MAFFDTTWYCNFGDGSTTGYYAVAKRAQNAAVTIGQIVRQFTTPSVGSERVFLCTGGGTTANTTDATWTITRGSHTTDGTVGWREVTGTSAINGDLTNTPSWAGIKAVGTPTSGVIIKRNNGASYQLCYTTGTLGAAEPAFSDTVGVQVNESGGTAQWQSLGPVGSFTGGQAPFARLASAFASTWFTSGNTVYVGDNHAETLAGNIVMAPSSALMAKILCHDHSGSYPPAAGNIMTGASVTTTGATNITFNGQGSFYFYGIRFFGGTTGIVVSPSAVGQTQNWYYFDNCSFGASGATAVFGFGASSTAWCSVIFNNTTIKFAGTASTILPYFASLVWQNTGQILEAGSSVPTSLFTMSSSSGRFNNITLRNLDLSQFTGSLFTNASNSSIGTLTVQDCKLNAAMTVTRSINSGMTVQMIRSDSAATAYKSTRYQYEGTETTETSIVRTGGAVDPTGIAQSRKIVTTANAQWLRPFKAEPMAIYNTTVGSSVTATVCGTVNSGALPNNDDVWAEFEYLGSATHPLGTIVTTTKSSVLASNAAVASDSSTWSTTPVLTTYNGTTTGTVTVTGGGLTVTHGSTTSGIYADSLTAVYAGKYYFEVTVGSKTANGHSVGIWHPTLANTNAFLTISNSGCDIYMNTVSVVTNIGTAITGSVIGFAVDLNSNLIWIRVNVGNWNGNGSANPATGVGGLATSAGLRQPFVNFAIGGAIDYFVGNFGGSAYANAAPSGFSNWNSDWSPFKLATTITPQLPGYIHARVRAAKISSTYYIDPKIVLS
jgi:hypothetical protein